MLTAIEIGRRIADARRQARLSQAQLAGHLSISSQAVGKWERGESMPDIITFDRLASVLGVELNYFSENALSGGMTPLGEPDGTTSPVPGIGPAASADPADPVALLAEPLVAVGATASTQRQFARPAWNMSGGNWEDVDFSGLANLGEKFSGSNIVGCSFRGADLSGLALKGNNVRNNDFSDSDLTNSKITGSHIVGCSFARCCFSGAQIKGSHMQSCDFTEARLEGLTVDGSTLEGCTLAGDLLQGALFRGSYFKNMLIETSLADCAFENCAYQNVTFRGVTLTNTFFKSPHPRSFKKAYFIDCSADRITYTFLKNGKADMSGVALLED
ncbi:MAG: pentapeptide repeat-containing protein [Coriobacteriales bacterium]|jgi:uncharacterized protein YjbI with pentapeptide repeats/transcriptional regulator with XRE-family HTH domain|nr:pentapeptide repeat-containing protein [Coriobacteriales bacterium]